MLKDYLAKLRGTSSTNDKKAICIALKNTMLYSTLIEYVYSPYKTYYIKGRKPNLCNVEEPTPDLFKLLDALHSRSLSGHAAHNAVTTWAKTHGDLIYLVLDRSLGGGVSYKILADAGFVIPKFNIQLAKESNKPRKYPLMAQTKYDGVRLLYNTSDKTFYTRSGKSFKSKTMSSWLQNFPEGYMIDGELVLDTNVQEDRQVVSGYITKLLSGNVIIPYDKLVYQVFDLLHEKEFKQCHVSPVWYIERFNKLANLLVKHPNVQLAKTVEVSNDSEVDFWFDNIISAGGEGLILKSHSHKYQYKRTEDWEKLKATYSETFKVVGIEEGKGKYEGMIGALICENSSLGIKTKVGSGLTDYLRSLPTEHFIDKHIEVLFNTITTNEKGDKSLFLPRFKCFRYKYDMS